MKWRKSLNIPSICCALALWLSGVSSALPQAAAGDEPAVFPRLGFANGLISFRGWAFSPDARYLVTADNAALRVWEVASWREFRSLHGHTRTINEVSLSADGQTAATISDDGTVRLWDWRAGKLVRTIVAPSDSPGAPAYGMNSVALSPDGRLVAASIQSGLAIWSTQDGKLALHIRQTGDAIEDWGLFTVGLVRFSDNEHLVLEGSGGIVLWSHAKRKMVRMLQRGSGTVSTLTVSRDGRWLLVRDTDDNVQVVEIASGETRLQLKADAAALAADRVVTCHRDKVQVTPLPDGAAQAQAARCGVTLFADPHARTALISISAAQLTSLDLATGAAREIRLGYTYDAGFALAGREPLFLTAGHGGAALRGWKLHSGEEALVGGGPGNLMQVAMSADDSMLAIVAQPPILNPDPSRFGYGVRLIDLKTGALRLIAESPVIHLALSGNGTRLLTTSGTIKLWNTRTGELVRELKELPYPNAVALSPDGAIAVAAGTAGEIAWRVDDGDVLWRISRRATFEEYDQMFSVAFTPDGESLLFGSMRGPIHQRNARSGELERTLGGHAVQTDALAVSRDGRLIASAGWDSRIQVRQSASGRISTTLPIGGARPSRLAFSGDAKRLLASLHDGSVRVWDVAGGRELAAFISFLDGQWMVITPEGYFNGSSRAPEHMNVRVGDRVASLSRFYDAFFRPDLVERKLRGEDISGLGAKTIAETLSNPPPQVEFLGGVQAKGEHGLVRFRVASTGGGIGDIRVFHNGKLVRSDPAPAMQAPPARIKLAEVTPDAVTRGLEVAEASARERPKPLRARPDTIEETVSVLAVPGENEITVTAFNRTDTVQSEPATIRFTTTLRDVAPVVHVLAVGIDEYRERPLKFAAKDARDFAAALQAAARGGSDRRELRIRHLLDGAATRGGIVAELASIAEAARPWDTVIVFVASHGTLAGGGYAIVTQDFDGRLPGGLIGADELLEHSKAIPSLNQLIVLDTCHAGGLNSLARGLLDARMSVLSRGSGMHIFASASETQQAIDGYQGNGLLTHALLRAMRDPVTDQNDDRMVSIMEWGQAARRLALDIGKRIGTAQTPAVLSFGKDAPLFPRP